MASNPPSTSTTTTTTTVSVSAYLGLAPTNTDKFTSEEIRALVLEYLCSSCYADSAKSFAQELQIRNELELAERSNANGSGVLDSNSSGSGSNGNKNGGTGRKGKESSRLTTIQQESLLLGSSNGHSRSSSSSGMEGIESTPPLMSQSEGEIEKKVQGDDIEMDDAMEDDELEEDLEVESNLRSNGSISNGKAVAFYDEATEEEREQDGWPGLSKEDLRLVRLRRDIRDDILSGRIQRAIDLLTEHFPSVLESTPQLSPTTDACLPNTFFISTTSSGSAPTISTSLTLPRSQVPIIGTTFTNSALSLEPNILSLNLQLQSFVELIRTANSTSTPSTPTNQSTSGDSPPPSNSNGGGGGMSSSMSSIISTRTNSMMKAIAHSQALGAKVREMSSGKVKEEWERECVDVSGLMAYTDLNICPVRGYLAQERRETLAELINAAILKSLNKTPMPVLALAARQTTAIWSALAEWKVPFPPGGVKSKVPKSVGRFDLRTFLKEGESSIVEQK